MNTAARITLVLEIGDEDDSPEVLPLSYSVVMDVQDTSPPELQAAARRAVNAAIVASGAAIEIEHDAGDDAEAEA